MAKSPIANVPLSAAEEAKYQAQEERWTAPRLVALTAVTLILSLIFLYTIAQFHTETTWNDWLIPG